MLRRSGQKNAYFRVVSRYLGLFFAAWSSWAAVVAKSPAEVIVQRSVANTNADWAAAPQYDFSERDVITKNGKRTVPWP
jgi:hypothetical protein